MYGLSALQDHRRSRPHNNNNSSSGSKFTTGNLYTDQHQQHHQNCLQNDFDDNGALDDDDDGIVITEPIGNFLQRPHSNKFHPSPAADYGNERRQQQPNKTTTNLANNSHTINDVHNFYTHDNRRKRDTNIDTFYGDHDPQVLSYSDGDGDGDESCSKNINHDDRTNSAAVVCATNRYTGSTHHRRRQQQQQQHGDDELNIINNNNSLLPPRTARAYACPQQENNNKFVRSFSNTSGQSSSQPTQVPCLNLFKKKHNEDLIEDDDADDFIIDHRPTLKNFRKPPLSHHQISRTNSGRTARDLYPTVEENFAPAIPPRSSSKPQQNSYVNKKSTSSSSSVDDLLVANHHQNTTHTHSSHTRIRRSNSTNDDSNNEWQHPQRQRPPAVRRATTRALPANLRRRISMMADTRNLTTSMQHPNEFHGQQQNIALDQAQQRAAAAAAAHQEHQIKRSMSFINDSNCAVGSAAAANARPLNHFLWQPLPHLGGAAALNGNIARGPGGLPEPRKQQQRGAPRRKHSGQRYHHSSTRANNGGEPNSEDFTDDDNNDMDDHDDEKAHSRRLSRNNARRLPPQTQKSLDRNSRTSTALSAAVSSRSGLVRGRASSTHVHSNNRNHSAEATDVSSGSSSSNGTRLTQRSAPTNNNTNELLRKASRMSLMSSMSKRNIRIVVIGAGVAGLAAASHLLRSGYGSVTLLEALDRVGGRVRTKQTEHFPLEFGAAAINPAQPVKTIWLNATVHRAIVDKHALAVIDKILTKTEDFLSMYASLPTLLLDEGKSNGGNNKFNSGGVYAAHVNGLSAREARAWLQKASIGELYERDMCAYIDERFGEIVNNSNSEADRRLALCAKDFVERHMQFEYGCDALADMSVIGWSRMSRSDIASNDNDMQKSSLDSFVVQLSKTIPDACVRLNSPVRKVILVDECDRSLHPLRVMFGPDEASQVFRADHVILTCSLGVLKSSTNNSMFEPKLPTWKRDAIDAAGFGHSSKLFLVFDSFPPLDALIGDVSAHGASHSYSAGSTVSNSNPQNSNSVVRVNVIWQLGDKARIPDWRSSIKGFTVTYCHTWPPSPTGSVGSSAMSTVSSSPTSSSLAAETAAAKPPISGGLPTSRSTQSVASSGSAAAAAASTSRTANDAGTKLRVLCFEVGGRAARRIDRMADEKVISDLIEFLRVVLGYEGVAKPTRFLRARWSKNPFFYGSLSFPSMAFARKGYDTNMLAEPCWYYCRTENSIYRPGLLFAGEATHESQFATVEGALQSGWREAERLMSSYDEQYAWLSKS